ncbi:MAG: M12 family metallo-peptidase [Bacteroidetes bacterium]|nr:M12 family metallo-peptidase [Bacteroidota bacterium]
MKILNYLSIVLFMSAVALQSPAQGNMFQAVASSAALGTSSTDYPLFDASTKRSAAAELDYVTKGTILNMDTEVLSDLRTATPVSFTLQIPMDRQEDLIINLTQVNIFSPDFILESSDGVDRSDVDLGVHYRGTVVGAQNSVIAISIFADQIRGVIVADEANYNLGPISIGSHEYICYKSVDLSDALKSSLNYSCGTTEEDSDVYTQDQLNYASRAPGDVTDIYIEVDKTIFDTQGSVANATAYTTSLFNQNAAIYAAESVASQVSQIFVWSTTDPYDGVNVCSSDIRGKYLCDFQDQFNGFNGDLAILLLDLNIGGLAAGFNGICNADPDQSMCISGQAGTGINTFPTYSYNTYIFAHELGHLFGSRHTHACVWNGNNTAIDGCSGTEGGCPLPPVPASGAATIMSYCQAQLAGGYIASAPFGPQPGNVIRSVIANATCLGGACTTGTIIYLPNSTADQGPALVLCNTDPAPANYTAAADQSCAQSTIDADAYCLTDFWDGICQAAYDACANPVGCQTPTNLGVLQIGFGTATARVNATWTNPEGTTSCEVRGGRISPASYAAGEPEFANPAQTQTITQTNGSTVLFNIVLFNNPNIPFTVGQRYGYDVRCQCADGSGFSEWANITPASTFVVPAPPPGVEADGSKLLNAGIDAMNIFPNPAQDILNIELKMSEEGSVEILLMNALGQTVMQERSSGKTTMNRLDVSDLQAGMYMLSVRTASGMITERVIVK